MNPILPHKEIINRYNEKTYDYGQDSFIKRFISDGPEKAANDLEHKQLAKRIEKIETYLFGGEFIISPRECVEEYKRLSDGKRQ